MADYLVLARKYRSETFDQVVGQEPIARTLVSAIESGRVAHAYLFAGTRGVGKTTMARILAKALNCLSVDAPTPNPCNRCNACVAIARGDDIDVAEIDGASNRGIDEIRQLRANAILRPARSRYRVYYIDEVHMLTREAFNALLKTLEEPPGHVKFIFATTEAEKVPATILSRCQRFDFRNIPTRKIAEHLATICKAEGVQADRDALFRIARAASGSMRDGLSLLDQLLAGGGQVSDAEAVRLLGTPTDERTIAIARAIADGSAAGALGGAGGRAGVGRDTRLGRRGDRGGLPTHDADRHLRRRQRPGGAGRRAAPARWPSLPADSRCPALVQAVGILATLARNLRTSSLARPLLEAGLVRLAEADKFIDPDSLIERLEALGSGAAPPRPLPAASPRPTPCPPPAPRRPPKATPAANPRRRSPRPPALQWDASWLAANWPQVIQALMAARQMQVAGLIAPASPPASPTAC